MPRRLTRIHLNSCPSTNDFIRKNRISLESKFPVRVTTEQQTAGRGRKDRHWFSPPGAGLYVSFGQYVDTGWALNHLPLAAALAVGETVHHACGSAPVLKWPNDILVKDKKIAGILIENSVSGDIALSICGIGINLNQRVPDFPEEIRDRAISLRMVDARQHSANSLVEDLSDRFCRELDQLQCGGSEKLIDRCNRLAAPFQGREITLSVHRRTIRGRFLSIDRDGGMIFMTQQGVQKKLFSGEIFPA